MSNVIKLDLDLGNKTKVQLGEDENTCVELNLSDMGIINRLSKAQKDIAEQLKAREEKWGNLENATNEDISNLLDETETEIRKIVDYIFDAPVSDSFLKNTSALSVCNGEYAYEILIAKMFELYEKTIAAEAKKMQKRIKGRSTVQKYIK